MIKLKVGNNYLVTTPEDPSCERFIVYMMSCFKGENKVVVGLCPHHKQPSNQIVYKDVIDFIRDNRLNDIIFLYPENIPSVLAFLIKDNVPEGTKYKFLKITKENFASREYKMAQAVYNSLRVDETNILNHLQEVNEYRPIVNRYKQMVDEIKVIDDNINGLIKKKKEAQPIRLSDLEHLNLIEKVELNGENLRIHIKPLYINPSEPLGLVYKKQDFDYRPYLYDVCKYIYLGNHFKMPGTIIEIGKNFRPVFIETKDHRWDKMFRNNNWSTIGYPHFGMNHLCPGEFNDTIAHATEYGLLYYFLCLKQYLTTANMRDIAGVKVLWFPIYDDNDNLIYCAGLEAYRQAYKRKHGPSAIDFIAPNDYNALNDFANEHEDFGSVNIQSEWRCDSGYNSSKEDAFLALCKEREPEVYEQIMKKGSR